MTRCATAGDHDNAVIDRELITASVGLDEELGAAHTGDRVIGCYFELRFITEQASDARPDAANRDAHRFFALGCGVATSEPSELDLNVAAQTPTMVPLGKAKAGAAIGECLNGGADRHIAKAVERLVAAGIDLLRRDQ